MWDIRKGRRARLLGLQLCLLKVVDSLAALPGGERDVCAHIHFKDGINSLQSMSVSLPHKTLFGDISLGREFCFEIGRKKARNLIGK